MYAGFQKGQDTELNRHKQDDMHSTRLVLDCMQTDKYIQSNADTDRNSPFASTVLTVLCT